MLRADADQRDLYWKRLGRDRVHPVKAPIEAEAWRRLLDAAEPE